MRTSALLRSSLLLLTSLPALAAETADPCQLTFKRMAVRRYVLDNELTLGEYVPKTHGDIRFDQPPWDAECPNGRVWGTLAVLPDGYAYKYLFLTMDRANFPGIPTPNWTYGALYLYGAQEVGE